MPGGLHSLPSIYEESEGDRAAADEYLDDLFGDLGVLPVTEGAEYRYAGAHTLLPAELSVLWSRV